PDRTRWHSRRPATGERAARGPRCRRSSCESTASTAGAARLMLRPLMAATLCVAVAVAVAGVGAPLLASPEDDGMESFVLGTFGGVTWSTLRSAAFPYKVVATGLVLREERASGRQLTRADLRDIFRAFGMQVPATIANWTPGRTQPKFDRPVGMVGAMVRGPSPFVRVDGVNIGCATCHSAPLYDANGRATDTLWVGMPNASLDIDAFSRAVLDGL